MDITALTTPQTRAASSAASAPKAEAAAMVATWRALWFEDGVRVLFMVPREFTDQALPLDLDPAPDELVRVLVGRVDCV